MSAGEQSTASQSWRGEKLSRHHHYVSQFILRNFAQNGKIQVFDKHTLREHSVSPRTAMAERDFNNVEIDDIVASFEDKFTLLENRAAPVVRKVIKQRSLQALSPMEQASLHMFCALQHLRSKVWRLNQDAITNEIRRRWPDAPINPFPKRISDAELAKLSALKFTFENLEDTTRHFVVKHSYLMVRDCDDEIYISDNPLVMHNQKTFGPYGNIGLAVPGIEIYYPLSPDVVLAYMCPLTLKEIAQAHKASEKTVSSFFGSKFLSRSGLTNADLAALAQAKSEMQRAKSYCGMLKDERAVPIDAENALYLNSLQVGSSYRYLAARRAKFSFVRHALRERPHWREGWRVTVN